MKKVIRLLLVFFLFSIILPNINHRIIDAARATPNPIKIVIDPGHGGRDPGAIGVNGLQEKDANLDMALKLREILQQAGYQVVMTRDSDQLLIDYQGSSQKYLDLQARADVATRENADLFVSIHCNSYTASNQGTLVLYYDAMNQDPQYPGTETMKKWTNENKILASSVLNSVTSQMGTKALGIDPSNVYVIRSGTVPSILVETAFLSNREEAEKLASPEFRAGMASAIAKGIMNYLPPRYIDIRNNWAKNEIASLSYMGIIQGYKDHLFRPEQSLSRVELMSLIDKAFGLDELLDKTNRLSQTEDQKPSIQYTDLSEDYWAYKEIMNATSLGIVTGYPDGSFRPAQIVSREEVAAILYRTLMIQEELKQVQEKQTTDESTTNESTTNESTTNSQTTQTQSENETDPLTNENLMNPFMDLPNDHWSSTAILTLKNFGIITGINSNTFGLGKNMSRAEAATMLFRTVHTTTDSSLVAYTNYNE